MSAHSVRTRGLSVLAGGAALLTTLAALRLAWLSRGWPLVHDAPLMHYIAWRILEGAAPYRDLFDMNFPGVYAAHVLLLLTLGPGDVAFRVFDLVALLVTGAGLCVALRGVGTVGRGWPPRRSSRSTTWRVVRGSRGSASSCSAPVSRGGRRGPLPRWMPLRLPGLAGSPSRPSRWGRPHGSSLTPASWPCFSSAGHGGDSGARPEPARSLSSRSVSRCPGWSRSRGSPGPADSARSST